MTPTRDIRLMGDIYKGMRIVWVSTRGVGGYKTPTWGKRQVQDTYKGYRLVQVPYKGTRWVQNTYKGYKVSTRHLHGV